MNVRDSVVGETGSLCYCAPTCNKQGSGSGTEQLLLHDIINPYHITQNVRMHWEIFHENTSDGYVMLLIVLLAWQVSQSRFQLTH